MKKSEVFANIKDVNKLVDEQSNYAEGSKDYEDISNAIDLAIDLLTMGYHPWYSVHLSKRTGHYYVRFAD